MKNRWKAWAGACALVALVVLPVLAGIDMEGANPLAATPASFSVTTSAVDSSDPMETAPVRRLAVMGNPTVYVSPLYSEGGGGGVTATVQIECYGPDGDDAGTELDWIGTAYTGTVTFSATASNGRYFTTSTIQADITAGATYVDVRVTAISVGATTCYFRRWVGVANSRSTNPS